MRLFPTKTPSILKRLYPKRIWSFSPSSETVYLTFDDGPIPEVTPWVLDTLAEYHAKATFFCIGENIQKHPEVFNRIITEGHAVGNHTQHHVNGWKTTPSTYIKNVEAAEKVISEHSNRKSKIELTWLPRGRDASYVLPIRVCSREASPLRIVARRPAIGSKRLELPSTGWSPHAIV